MKYKVSEQDFGIAGACNCKDRDFTFEEGDMFQAFECLECGGFFMRVSDERGTDA